ncbi:MAG TPA: BTAD domain-containing putative transcriptional regulator [Umezawaea sp.]|nr:BTAD domain-containing putative transcriptional regulator [Umezawaea sp.]
MEFRVLGSLEVSTGGEPIRLTGGRQRTLLALLLLNADHVVPLDALIDAVWDERPPTTAKRQVQNSVSALRRLLEAGERDPDPAVAPTIAAEGNGYRLRLGAGTLDARLFLARVEEALRLSAAGEVGPAAAELRAGLRLWRGPALAGLAGRAFEAPAARLDEQRRAAIEECVELELGLGRHADLVGELAELVASHPLRERLVGQLMVALHRSGRQAEALEVYRGLRGALAEELGLEPGARLRELHTAILRDEAGSTKAVRSRHSAARVVPAQLPVDVFGFTGRARHLKELDEVLPGGAGTVVTTIAGTAGIGKTALAVHWGQRVRHHFPEGQLYADLRGFDPDGSPMRPAEVLLGFLEALDVPPPRVPVGLAARSALYRSLLADRRVLVVLDNARDADQVRPLLPGSRDCLVVVTSRRVLSGLVAAEGARPVVLDLFDPAEAQQMLARRLGRERLAAEPDAVDEIIGRCASLPLALAVVAARAAVHPDFPLASLADELRAAQGSLDALGSDDPTTDVRAVFSWSYQQLSDPARRLFRLLGLHPCPDVTVRAAASLSGLPVDRTRMLLAELASACLVTARAPGRYASHDLLRAYAAELARGRDTAEQRREALHRLFDHYLHGARAADRLLDAHRDPITFPPVRPGVVVDEPADHDQAMRWLADELAGILAVVERAASTGFDAHAWRLAWAVAYFVERRGHWEPWAEAQHTALASARRLGDRVGQAHAHRSLGRVHVHLDRVADAIVHLGQAQRLYRETGDTAGEARVHFDLCWIDYRQGEHRTSLAHAERAFELFREIGHLSGQARALNNIAWGHDLRGDHERALDAAERALRLNEEVADRFSDADTWDVLGHAHRGLGHHDESIACYRRAAELYRDLGHRWAEAEALARLGDAHHGAGAVAAAHDNWRRALIIFDELGHPDADAVRSKLGA